ncbi:AraC family transcriptional regulator [Paenibacillus sp. 1011MAR3C5]|uniref:helix-turn-helix domain-containing protein n=1 Tax=Paenibacillus sp. 1011MAR3C5 TaxID=1675787 RepID=UPI000E6BE40F|nr:helix-turn-helix domain-containing protein [Paenibacillus sp. 1011MAR3C5]RJE90595.1 AraC family transcriptional regulator [Paenibacillus sp. 1011MAR3C5]
MQNIRHRGSRLGFRSIFYRLIILFVSLSAFIQIALFLSTSISMNYIEAQLRTNYDRSLSNLSSTMNNLFDGIYQSNFLLALDPNILKVITTQYAEDDIGKYADYSQAVRSLSRIKASSNYIDNAYIYKRDESVIISDNGTYEPESFYESAYKMEQYPLSFWQGYKTNHHLFTILPPSVVSSSYSNRGESTISVVQSTVGGHYSNNLYVINMKAEAVRNLLQSYMQTPNSLIMVADTEGNMLASTRMIDVSMQSFMNELLLNPETKFDAVHEGENMHIIKYTTNFFFRDVTMVVAVPHTDLTSALTKMKSWNVTITGILFLVSLLLSILFSRRFYSPIRSLVQTLQGTGSRKDKTHSPINELEFLNTEIKRILTDVDDLNRTLSYSLPIATKHFLAKVLQSNFPYDHDVIDSYLNKLDFQFPNPYFQVSLIQCNFRKPFYDLYSEKFQNEATDTIFRILNALLPQEHPLYILELDAHMFAVLTNPASKNDFEVYSAYFRQIDSLFRQDEAELRIHIGMGRVHENYTGMQTSYVEAMKALWQVSPFDSKRIVQYSEYELEEPRYVLSRTDEKILANLLAAGKREEFRGLLDVVIATNTDRYMTGTNMKQLFVHLYLIGIQALKSKNIAEEHEEELDMTQFLLSSDVGSTKEMTEHLYQFFDRVLELCESPPTDAFNIKLFRTYLDNHYAEEITLDILADKYNTTPKYMSRLLKKELGTTFHKYLQQLRIVRAKEMLTSSSAPIHEIWEQVGFNNRNTFIRTFKNQEGISPTDYRRCHRPSD